MATTILFHSDLLPDEIPGAHHSQADEGSSPRPGSRDSAAWSKTIFRSVMEEVYGNLRPNGPQVPALPAARFRHTSAPQTPVPVAGTVTGLEPWYRAPTTLPSRPA